MIKSSKMVMKNELNILIEELQGTNGVIDKLKAVIVIFEEMNLLVYNINELEDYFTIFQEKSNQISAYYESFIAAFIETDNEDERKTIKLYLDFCLVFINRIQNKYSNPISYRINYLNNQKSIKKANTSIFWGIISVIIGVIATAISVNYSVKPNDKLIFISNEIQEQTLKLNNLQKEYTSIDSLLRLDNIIQHTINKDSLVKNNTTKSVK